MAQRYQSRPSEILKIDDNYTAFCFDEACDLIAYNIADGKEPHYKTEKKEKSGNSAAISQMLKMGGVINEH